MGIQCLPAKKPDTVQPYMPRGSITGLVGHRQLYLICSSQEKKNFQYDKKSEFPIHSFIILYQINESNRLLYIINIIF